MSSGCELTLGDMIERNAQAFAEDDAFIYESETVTHREFARRARRLASAWHKFGLRQQDRVAILSQNRMEFFEVYGACEWAGFITVALNWRLAAPELLHIVKDSSPKLLIFEKEYAELISRLRADIPDDCALICLDGPLDFATDYREISNAGVDDGPPFRATPDHLVYLLYTSGTTGRPKGVMLGQREEVAAAQIFSADMQCTAADRYLLMMPLFHIGAKLMQVSQHWRGGAIILHRGFVPNDVLNAIGTKGATMIHMAPTLVQSLVEHPSVGQFDLSSLRTILYSAAPMPEPVLRRAIELFGPIFQQIYGQTEGLATTLHHRDHLWTRESKHYRRLHSVGTPSPEIRLRIVDAVDRDLPIGEPGEIVVKSAANMRGYWNNSAATIETLRDGWLHTGDIGKLDEDGFLYLVDRKKDMIISGGENIYSREVEETLLQHPDISDAAVIGVPHTRWGETVMAILVTKSKQNLSNDELTAHCKSLIASYKKPSHYRFVPELPRLPSGKVNKVSLRATFGPPAHE